MQSTATCKVCGIGTPLCLYCGLFGNRILWSRFFRRSLLGLGSSLFGLGSGLFGLGSGLFGLGSSLFGLGSSLFGLGSRIRIGGGLDGSCTLTCDVVSSSICKRCNGTAARGVTDVASFWENEVFTV